MVFSFVVPFSLVAVTNPLQTARFPECFSPLRNTNSLCSALDEKFLLSPRRVLAKCSLSGLLVVGNRSRTDVLTLCNFQDRPNESQVAEDTSPSACVLAMAGLSRFRFARRVLPSTSTCHFSLTEMAIIQLDLEEESLFSA